MVVTQPRCGFCDQAKGVLQRVGEDFDVQVIEVDAESDVAAELASETAAVFPPVVFINGSLFSYGRLSERKLRKRLTDPVIPRVR